MQILVAILTEGSSCCSALAAGRRRRWWWWLALYPKEPLKKVALRLRRCNWDSAGRGSRSTPRAPKEIDAAKITKEDGKFADR